MTGACFNRGEAFVQEAEWLSSNDFSRMLQAVEPSLSLRQSQLLACACLRFPRFHDEALLGFLELVEDHADSDRAEGTAGVLYWRSYRSPVDRLARGVVGVELRLEGDPHGRGMLRELMGALTDEAERLAVCELFEQEEYAWGLEELGATAWGAELVAAGLRRFRRSDETPLWPVGGANAHLLDEQSDKAKAWRRRHDQWRESWKEHVYHDQAEGARQVAREALDAHRVAALRDLCSDLIAPAEAQPAWAEPARPLAQDVYARRDLGRLRLLADVLWHAGCRDERLLAHCLSPGPHFRGCWALDVLLGKG